MKNELRKKQSRINELENSMLWKNLALVVLGVIGILFFIFWCSVLTELYSLGQMVCDENDKGKFVSYSTSKKIITCYEKPDLEEYDGGFINTITINGKNRE